LRNQGAADPRIRRRHGDAGLRPARRRPRRDRRLQGPDRRRLEGLRSPGRSPGREEGRHRPDRRLRGLTPPAGTERSPPLFPPVAELNALLKGSPPMSVSFTLLKVSGRRFDLLPGHDDREFSLSNANAADVLDALGIEDSFFERPWPIQCFRTLLIGARRKRLGHASPAIPVTETQESGKMLVIDCGRAE